MDLRLRLRGWRAALGTLLLCLLLASIPVAIGIGAAEVARIIARAQ